MGRTLTLLIVVVTAALCESRDIVVSSSYCGGTYSLDSGSVTLRYTGSPISSCRFTITTSDISKKICSSPQEFDLKDCDTTIEYHDGYYSSYSADATYSCGQKQYSSHCTTFSTLIVEFKGGDSTTSDDIELKFSEEDDGFVSDVVDTVKTTVYVIVGVIVGVIVLVIIVVVVVIFLCCRRQQSRPGQVYRAQQQPAVVTTTYPMQNQGGYQPVQVGYQPPPQAGFQQPPPAGYQPQPAGYPPAPQQGYAGHQTGADTGYPEKASAPPMGEQPPPYQN